MTPNEREMFQQVLTCAVQHGELLGRLQEQVTQLAQVLKTEQVIGRLALVEERVMGLQQDEHAGNDWWWRLIGDGLRTLVIAAGGWLLVLYTRGQGKP